MDILAPTKGSCGRRGLPKAYKDRIVSDYLRLKSTRKVAALHDRTPQAIWEILKTAKCQMQPTRPPTKYQVEYKGRRFTPDGSGFLRDTLHGRRDGLEKQLNRQVWVDHNGPIPAGHEICFRDRNRMNCDISNLECLPKREARRKYSRGVNGHTKRLLNERLEQHMGMVMRYALRLNRIFPEVPVEDLVQQGRLGIVEAHGRFKKEKGVKFLTYAIWWIRSMMGKWVEANAKMIRMPATRMADAPVVVSLNAPLGDDEDSATVADLVGADETVTDAVDAEERAALLAKAMTRLPARHREVLRLRFWENQTLDEIGARLQLSRERIRQIEAKALRLLRTKKAIRDIHRIREAA